MEIRRPLVLVAAALIGAAALTAFHGSEPLDERIVRMETEKVLPELAGELSRHPPEVGLAFLQFAGDETLVLGARLALAKHPDMAPRVIALYGHAEPFRDILDRHGAAVVPPIHYFLENDPLTMRLQARLAGNGTDEPDTDIEASPPDTGDALTPEARGWYAVNAIDERGHDFLGQFVIDENGEVAWLQTERFATGTKRLFTSGLTGLETKWRQGDDIGAADYGWAAVDIAVPVVAFRLARAGKLTGHAARSTRGSAALARTGAGTARIGRTLAIAGTAAGIGYIAMNPGVLSSIGAGIANTLGLPAWSITGLIWFLLLLPLFVMLNIVRRWLLAPAWRLLTITILALQWLRRRISVSKAA